MNGWKITAIIFIILFILETIGIIWIMALGVKEINNDYECGLNCDEQGFTYYYESNICSCFNEYGDRVNNFKMS